MLLMQYNQLKAKSDKEQDLKEEEKYIIIWMCHCLKNASLSLIRSHLFKEHNELLKIGAGIFPLL